MVPRDTWVTAFSRPAVTVSAFSVVLFFRCEILNGSTSECTLSKLVIHTGGGEGRLRIGRFDFAS